MAQLNTDQQEVTKNKRKRGNCPTDSAPSVALAQQRYQQSSQGRSDEQFRFVENRAADRPSTRRPVRSQAAGLYRRHDSVAAAAVEPGNRTGTQRALRGRPVG